MSEVENPPAFPSVCIGDPGHPASIPGMTLRDYFAGQAAFSIGGYIAQGKVDDRARAHAVEIAAHAYCIADAMLQARSAS